MITLKPCPFCGSENVEFIPNEEQAIDNTKTGFILCFGCGFSTDTFYSERHAAKAWNRRAQNDG